MNASKLFLDAHVFYTSSYQEFASFIVSCLFLEIGAYDLLNTTSQSDYRNVINIIANSYFYNSLHELSIQLKTSFLYTHVSIGASGVHLMNDDGLSMNVIRYKHSVIHLVENYASFLASCDLEHAGLFLYTHSEQALSDDEFNEQYVPFMRDVQCIFKRFHRLIPKVYMSALDNLQLIGNVRYRSGSFLRIVPSETPCLQSKSKLLTVKDFNSIIKQYVSPCDVVTLHKTLHILYTYMIPLYVIGYMQWMFVVQGPSNNSPSLYQLLGSERIKNIQKFRHTCQSRSFTLMKFALLETYIMKYACAIADDEHFLKSHSCHMLGHVPQTLLISLTHLYTSNVELLVLSDMLQNGLYDSLTKEHQFNMSMVSHIVDNAEKDIIKFNDQHPMLRHHLHHVQLAFKKVQRYARWLRHIEDMPNPLEVQQTDMIFGNLDDTTCAVCFETALEKHDTWFQYSCGHIYHLSCVNNMVDNQITTCPQCRNSLYQTV